MVDADGTASDTTLAATELAIANFAAWTGDVGVCVPEVRVRADLPEPLGVSSGWEVAGRYRGRHGAIDVLDDADAVWGYTFHELCHAVDRIEDHSGLASFPALADTEVVPERRRAGEDFAIACESGPADTVLDTFEADHCGSEPVYGDGDRYVADVVFPEAPRWRIGDTIPVTVTERADRFWYVQDAIGYDGGVAVVMQREAEGFAGWDLWVDVYEADFAELRASHRVAKDVARAEARLIPADEGLWAVVVRSNESGWSEANLFDLAGNRRLPFPEEVWPAEAPDRGPVPAAISGGVLYGRTGGTLRAWTLEAEELAFDLPFELFGAALAPDVLWATDTGIGFVADEGMGTFDASTGEWTLAPGPETATSYTALADGRALLGASWWWPHFFAVEDGVWSPVGGECVHVLPPSAVGTRIVAAADRLYGVEILFGAVYEIEL